MTLKVQGERPSSPSVDNIAEGARHRKKTGIRTVRKRKKLQRTCVRTSVRTKKATRKKKKVSAIWKQQPPGS